MSALGKRIAYCALQWLLLIDEGGQILIRSAIYIVTGQNPPTAHETISAWVGTEAARGGRVGLVAQRIIDGIFGAGHCARAAAFERSVETAD